jgi:hypothetical protein
MGENEGTVSKCATDLFRVTLEDLLMGVQVKEGVETKDVFDAFGLGKRNSAIGEVEVVTDIITGVVEISPFRRVPGDIDRADIGLGRL